MSINECTSLYIPYIATTFAPQDVAELFHKAGLGIVERVDFFENPKVTNGWAHSAFVHLRSWYFSEFTERVYAAINEKNGKWNLPVYDTSGKYMGYWLLRKMTTPKIPDTIYNIHQLAQHMDEMQREIDELRALVEGRNNQTITIEDRPNDEPLKLSDLISDEEDGEEVNVDEQATKRLKEFISG
jgi:hypothetical protein